MAETTYTDYAVVDCIAHHAGSTPDKLAMVELPSGRRYSYAQMHGRISRLAGHLRALGIGSGDRVGFLALNTTDILDLVFATWRIGGIAVALNFRLTAEELGFILADSGPRIIVHDRDMRETVDALKAGFDNLTWIETAGDGSDSAFETAIAQCREPVEERVPQALHDHCMLMYSSGTTGRPKGVIITHGMLHFSFAAGVGPGQGSQNSVSLAVMPLFHIAAMNVSCLPALTTGATTVVMRVFEPGAVLAVLGDREMAISHFFAVPAAFNALRQHPGAEATDLSRLVTVLSGAETVPPPLVAWWSERGVLIQEGFGLTETAGQGCLLAKQDVVDKIGSAGKPLIHSRMKIVKNDGTDAGPDETGEIWIKGAVVTPGYWKRPEATAGAFVDGWFRTGDIGRRDSEGYYYVEDRLKDMYISGGENIYPAEIEGVLYGMEDIAEVAVIGVSDGTWGQVGCAAVVPKSGRGIDLAAISGFCDGRLAKYKHPAHLVLLEALPRNATGKVLKFRLREMVPARLGL